jgi:hypothetical protein
MNTDLLISGSVNAGIALTAIALSIPLVQGKIKMNKWYGVRIPKSFVSEDNWLKINQYGGRALIYWSIPVLLISLLSIVISFYLPKTSPKDIAWLVPLSLSPLLLLGSLVQIIIWSRALPDKKQNA